MVFWMFLNMVAEVSGMPGTPDTQNDPGTPGSSGFSSTGSSTLTLGKVFGHCDKLNRKNYEIWLAGLISAITGLTVASKFYQQVEKTLRYIKTNAHLKLEEIELHVGSVILTLTLHAGDSILLL